MASKDCIRSVISNVAAACHLAEWTLSVKSFENGSLIKQNLYGVLVHMIHMVGKSKGAEIHLRLVLKLAPTEEQYRLSGRISVIVMFAREIVIL